MLFWLWYLGGAKQMFVGQRLTKTQQIFSDGQIVITPNLAQFGDVTYQISNIDSVRIVKKPGLNIESKKAKALLFAYAALGAVSSLVFFLLGNIFLGLIAFSAGVFFVYQVVFYVPPNDEFIVTLKTASGDIDALMTEDAEFAMRLKGAIETAFAHDH